MMYLPNKVVELFPNFEPETVENGVHEFNGMVKAEEQFYDSLEDLQKAVTVSENANMEYYDASKPFCKYYPQGADQIEAVISFSYHDAVMECWDVLAKKRETYESNEPPFSTQFKKVILTAYSHSEACNLEGYTFTFIFSLSDH